MKKSILLTALALARTAALACHQPPKRYYPQPEQSSVAPSPAQQWTHPSKATPAPEASAPASK